MFVHSIQDIPLGTCEYYFHKKQYAKKYYQYSRYYLHNFLLKTCKLTLLLLLSNALINIIKEEITVNKMK